MRIYLDSSVVTRIVLREPGALREWPQLAQGTHGTPVSSALIEVECLRALERERFKGRLLEEELPSRRTVVYEILEFIDLWEVDRTILGRASQPFPTFVKTLDAIHLATALQWQVELPDLVLATHDEKLAGAARAMGLKVIGS